MLNLFRGGAKVLSPDDPPDPLNQYLIKAEDECFLVGSGIPGSTVDSFAYEPVQKILAVGTSDGRVKLFGSLGVEKTLYSSAKKVTGTKQLTFIPNRGILLRLSRVCGSQSGVGLLILLCTRMGHDLDPHMPSKNQASCRIPYSHIHNPWTSHMGFVCEPLPHTLSGRHRGVVGPSRGGIR